MNHSTLPNDAELWRLPRVEDASGLKSSRIYELVAEDKFPQPVKLGLRASAWVSTEVLAWMAERIADRDELKNQARRQPSVPAKGASQNSFPSLTKHESPACFSAANLLDGNPEAIDTQSDEHSSGIVEKADVSK